jgi:uncharacterized repeat protein (TIGR01451 family)
MKQIQNHRNWYFAAMIAVIAIVALVPQQASAAGTASGTTINNAASVVYSVGSVTQPLYTGPTTTFAVDTKVIFNVSKVDVAPVQVAPGDNTSSTVRRLRFQLQNDSNANIRFQATAANLVSGLTVTFGATNYTDNVNTFSSITACFDANANNTCDGGENFATVNADALNTTIIITGDIPSNAVNADIVGTLLTATAVDAGGAPLVETAAPTISGVDVVLANGAGTDNIARSGTFTDRSSWQVSAALLTVTKTAVVYSDPYNGTTNPKAIPGAVITYTITVANGPGGATATNVTISDSLNAEITSVPAHLAFATQFNDGANACAAGQGVVVNNTCNTNLSDGDNADWNVTAANTITAGGLSLAPNSSAVVKFQAVIQ